MNFGFITTAPCVTTPTPSDPRCSDPAFAVQNPDICAGSGSLSPHLILKPSVALTCALGSIQFKAFLVTNGIEQDVSEDCVFSTSDMTVALIGASSGSCTGVSQGEATIAAEYLTFRATADLNVIGNSTDGSCCENESVAMMLMVQNSRVMSQSFSGDYPTRLDFAKAAAKRFISEVNDTKDLVGLMSFNDSGSTVQSDPSSDIATVEAAVDDIVQTQQINSFYDALVVALQELEDATSDLKVIVLISDGTDSGADAANGYVGGNNPITLLNDFKDHGGVVICLGCRAAPDGYALLSAFSTGGFFVNGYDGNESATLDFLSGLKGYICAGNCTPAGDTIVATPQLDYTDFINWDVIGGHVDLIGPGLFDFLPENGLYVDLAGSTYPAYGRMVSKSPFSLSAGHVYRIMVDLAGNQRLDDTPYSARLKVFYLNGAIEVPLVDQVIIVNDYTQDFHSYSFGFTSPSDLDVYISIQQQDVPNDLTGVEPFFGLLLGKVQFDDLSTLVNLLTDDFDTENLHYVPPRCGLGTTPVSGGYIYGYNCYGTGCLDTPPSNQQPDPEPLPPIEQGYSPPVEYTSTKEECVSCGTNSLALLASYSGEITSGLVADAGVSTTLAYYKVTSEAALPDPGYITVGWHLYGSNDQTTWSLLDGQSGVDLNVAGVAFALTGTTAYRYYKLYPSSGFTVYSTVGLSLFAPGTYEVCATATETSTVSQADADNKASAAAKLEAISQLTCVPAWTATASYTAKCPSGQYGVEVTKTASYTSPISLKDAQDQASALAQTQANAELDCTQSNNTQQITLPAVQWLETEYGMASPWPSVFYCNDIGAVTKVTVNLLGLKPVPNGNSWVMLLRGPDGTCVILWSDQGTTQLIDETPSVDITFDDAGAAMDVGPTSLDSGTYVLNNGNAQPALTMPPTAPAGPYGFALSDFIGIERNGPWSLWIAVRLSDASAILDGWTIAFD